MISSKNFKSVYPFLWGSAISAYQSEGAYLEDGKGLGEWDYFNDNSPMNINHVDAKKPVIFIIIIKKI